MFDLDDLHAAYLAEIQARVPGLQDPAVYPVVRQSLNLPTVLLELADAEPGQDPGTGELAIKTRWEARCVYDPTAPRAELAVRALAMSVAHAVWRRGALGGGLRCGACRLERLGPDALRPELDSYLVWVVEWTAQIHVGQSVWDGEGVMPSQIFLGYAPRVGIPHESEYEPIDPEGAV